MDPLQLPRSDCIFVSSAIPHLRNILGTIPSIIVILLMVQEDLHLTLDPEYHIGLSLGSPLLKVNSKTTYSRGLAFHVDRNFLFVSCLELVFNHSMYG